MNVNNKVRYDLKTVKLSSNIVFMVSATWCIATTKYKKKKKHKCDVCFLQCNVLPHDKLHGVTKSSQH